MAARIAHLSFSRTGGAGGVASRLADIQRRRGHDAFVVSAISGSLRDSPLATPLHTAAAVWDERVVRNPRFAAPISLARDALTTRVAEQLSHADIIHVHWPNGLISLESLATIAGNRPVVWTLHDMNAFTAVCHYSLECRGYMSGCSNCPAVKGSFRDSASQHLSAKKDALSAFADLRIVTPSSWLAREASASEALAGHAITTIPNPLPDSAISAPSRDEARAELGIDTAIKTVFAISASHLEDPLKAVGAAVSGFSRAFAGRDDVVLLVAGRGTLPSDRLLRHMGFVRAETSRTIFAASDYLLVPSLAENQPLVIAEAQASGASVIVRNSTGLPEHLDIDPTGQLFDSNESLPQVLAEAASRVPTNRERGALTKRAQQKFSAETAAEAYDHVYGL